MSPVGIDRRSVAVSGGVGFNVWLWKLERCDERVSVIVILLL